jgi:toxin ParE1/3/4
VKPLSIDARAQREFDAAAIYYEQQQEGLGGDFIAKVEEAYGRMAKMPRAFPIHFKSGMRKCVVRRFPYNIFFEELDDRIWIAAVVHYRR